MIRALALAAMIAASAMAEPATRSFSFDGNSAGSAVAPDKAYDGDFGYEPASTAAARLFSVHLPEGTYRVTLTLGSDRAASTTVKAEARRLMLHAVATRPGETLTRSFTVNVRRPDLPPPPANAPGGARVRLFEREEGSPSWDDRLTLEFLEDAAVRHVAITPAAVPTLFLAGDSTVTDQRHEPAASWGQMLPAFMGDGVAVANHAESGETLKSFLTGLRLDKLLSAMKAGDYLFIQFGHNDQKANWPQTYADAHTTYPAWLRAYIAEARRRGANPVLVTSPERRNFTGAKIRPTLSDHAAAMRRVAAEDGVPLIDLNAHSIRLMEALGPGRAAEAFNDGGQDRTHHNAYGAWLLASAVAEDIRRLIPALSAHVVAPPFDSSRPPLPDQLSVAPSASRSSVRPAGS